MVPWWPWQKRLSSSACHVVALLWFSAACLLVGLSILMAASRVYGRGAAPRFRSARSALIIGRLLWIVSVPSGYSYLQAIEETGHGNQSVRLSLAELMTGVIS
jgi:hypothetical protein